MSTSYKCMSCDYNKLQFVDTLHAYVRICTAPDTKNKGCQHTPKKGYKKDDNSNSNS